MTTPDPDAKAPKKPSLIARKTALELAADFHAKIAAQFPTKDPAVVIATAKAFEKFLAGEED